MGGGQAPNRGFNDREELSFCQMDKTEVGWEVVRGADRQAELMLFPAELATGAQTCYSPQLGRFSA